MATIRCKEIIKCMNGDSRVEIVDDMTYDEFYQLRDDIYNGFDSKSYVGCVGYADDEKRFLAIMDFKKKPSKALLNELKMFIAGTFTGRYVSYMIARI